MKRPLAIAAIIVATHLSGCRYVAPADRAARPEEDVQTLVRSFAEREPDNYVHLYTLARMAERRGDTREVVHWLRRLESTSWDRMIEDGDFPKSAGDASFVSVRDRVNARALVVRNAEDAFDVDEVDLLPEGMAYDPTADRFLFSSGRQRKVISVGRDGYARDHVAPAQDGVLATLGMKVDDRRREVWVASAAAPFMIDATDEDAERTALYVFDADTGATKGRWEPSWSPSMLNDLVVAPDGTVFATDSISGAVVRRVRGGDELDLFLPMEAFFSPNGIAIAEDGATLWVAHYHGISRVDVRTREVEALRSSDRTLHIGGVDGLYAYDGRLVAIQNLIGKGRIWSLELDGDRIARAEILESGNVEFRNPTTGAIAGDAFFFLSNPNLQQWDGEKVSPAPEGERHRVMWIPLERESGSP